MFACATLVAGCHAAGRGVQGKAADSTTPAAAVVIPVHDSFTLQSSALGEARLVNVYTPPQYRAGGDSATPLPVLYMPDGGLDEDFPHVVHMVDSLRAAGVIRPFIVVGIPNTQRRRDLTGPTAVKSDSAIAPRVGGSAAFRQFIAQELIPEIERRYRTTHERAIIGESLAGLFVMETFLTTPDLFTHYIAFDPSLWWNDGALAHGAAAQIARFDTLPRTLFFATSHEPSTSNGASRIDSLLRAAAPRGLRWKYVPRSDLEHSNIFHFMEREAISYALR